jgi:hypothetical protein
MIGNSKDLRWQSPDLSELVKLLDGYSMVVEDVWSLEWFILLRASHLVLFLLNYVELLQHYVVLHEVLKAKGVLLDPLAVMLPHIYEVLLASS